ncbi:hypothetical protein D9619_012667 [Psilocybe cf. subviscida]|uniref:F-box domain-containing protein n=1 Tax=Psilocybe cf. subviscida TaxID=2480587 RepID=A0A8H5B6M5_9AGAR|nr:hypothetical protein D9619_012667 [Psilocybe cf. subviscida]
MAQPLPLELYHAIIQHVDKWVDLYSLALCCSAFRDEAQRCLFRYVELHSERRHTLFISAVNASPLRLGPLVHAFYLNSASAPRFGMEDPTAPLSISLALRSMCNLEHFKNEWLLPSTILRECTFKLRTLVWDRYLDKSSRLFLLCHFLPTQPSIRRLDLNFGESNPSDLVEVPTDLCPMLDFLEVTDNNIINHLLRDDRLITRFQWESIGGGLPTMSTRQLNHLKYLRCVIDVLNMNPSFTLQLNSLVCLELFRIKFLSKYLDRLMEVLQFLQNLPRLEVLVLEETYDNILNIPAYHHAFKLCPTLKHIDARRGGRTFYERFFPPEDGILITNMRIHKRDVLGWRREYGAGPAWLNYI